MTVDFTATGTYTKTKNCVCVDMYATGTWLPGHDECPGFIVVGERVPELNCSNRNARNLLSLLDLEFDQDGYEGGKVGAADLQLRIAKALKRPLDEFAVKPTRSESYPLIADAALQEIGAVVYDCGLTEEKLGWYLEQLFQVAAFAIDQGIDTVSWG